MSRGKATRTVAGLSIRGIDRVSGEILDVASFSSTTLGRDLAAAGSGDRILVAYVEDERVKAISATCVEPD